jgi:hypothetical protein
MNGYYSIGGLGTVMPSHNFNFLNNYSHMPGIDVTFVTPVKEAQSIVMPILKRERGFFSGLLLHVTVNESKKNKQKFTEFSIKGNDLSSKDVELLRKDKRIKRASLTKGISGIVCPMAVIYCKPGQKPSGACPCKIRGPIKKEICRGLTFNSDCICPPGTTKSIMGGKSRSRGKVSCIGNPQVLPQKKASQIQKLIREFKHDKKSRAVIITLGLGTVAVGGGIFYWLKSTGKI